MALRRATARGGINEPTPLKAPLPLEQVLQQRLVEADAGVHRDVIDVGLGALAPVALLERAHRLEVIAAHAPGVEGQTILTLHVLELDQALNGEVDHRL